MNTSVATARLDTRDRRRGATGFIVETLNQAVDAAARVGTLGRAEI
jgi:hypothetical protein